MRIESVLFSPSHLVPILSMVFNLETIPHEPYSLVKYVFDPNNPVPALEAIPQPIESSSWMMIMPVIVILAVLLYIMWKKWSHVDHIEKRYNPMDLNDYEEDQISQVNL